MLTTRKPIKGGTPLMFITTIFVRTWTENHMYTYEKNLYMDPYLNESVTHTFMLVKKIH